MLKTEDGRLRPAGRAASRTCCGVWPSASASASGSRDDSGALGGGRTYGEVTASDAGSRDDDSAEAARSAIIIVSAMLLPPMAAASCRSRAAAVNEQSSRRQQLGGECRAEMGSGGGDES
jgi:hypothetical protein